MSRAQHRWASRALLVVELFLAMAVLAQRLPLLWSDRWAQDDAYISFRYAKHFVQGHGLVYNLGQRVEGYTNFLWTLLAAIPLAWHAEDPLPFMHTVSAALWVGSYGLLLWLGVRLFREGIWIAPLAVIPLAYHWSFNMWFFSGMETPLVSFLVIAILCAFSIDAEAHPAVLFWMSLCGVALMMTRPDGVIVLGAVALASLIIYWRPLLIQRRWRTFIGLPLVPIVFVYLPYTLWRLWYYGSFYPNTYYAKSAYLTFYSRGWVYLSGYFQIYPFAVWLTIVAVAPLLARTPVARRFLLGTVLTTIAVFFYVVRLGGDFMEWRFLTPVTGVLYPAIVISVGVVLRRFGTQAFSRAADPARVGSVSGWMGGIAIVLILSELTTRATYGAQHQQVADQETIGILRRYCDVNVLNWGAVGKLFDQILPRNVTIATTSAGIIPYYCDRSCLDLHGLTDAEIAHEPVDPEHRGRTGHDHWLQDFDRMRERGVDIYLAWAEPRSWAKSLITPPQPDLEMVSARMPDGGFTEFLILNHKAVDMDVLRKDPRLVFYGSPPLSERGAFYATRARFRGYAIIDTLDLEEDASQRQHEFAESSPSGPPPHVYHTKILHYAAPFGETVVHDNGFRIASQARWKIQHVTAERPLVMIARFDHTGGASYQIEVNGHRLPKPINFPSAPEAWDEATAVVPPEFLIEGTNEIHLARAESSFADAEMYYLWFLQQPTEPEIVPAVPWCEVGAAATFCAAP